MIERDAHGTLLGWEYNKELNNMWVIIFHLRGDTYHTPMFPKGKSPYCFIPANLNFFNQLKHVYPNFPECSLREIAERMANQGYSAEQRKIDALKIYELVIKNIHISLYGFDQLKQRYQDISADSLIKIVQFIYDDYMRRRGGVDIENSNEDILEKIYGQLYQANIPEGSLKSLSALIGCKAKPSGEEAAYVKFREEFLKIKNRAFIFNLDCPGPVLLLGAALATTQVILFVYMIYLNFNGNFSVVNDEWWCTWASIRILAGLFYTTFLLDFDWD